MRMKAIRVIFITADVLESKPEKHYFHGNQPTRAFFRPVLSRMSIGSPVGLSASLAPTYDRREYQLVDFDGKTARYREVLTSV